MMWNNGCDGIVSSGLHSACIASTRLFCRSQVIYFPFVIIDCYKSHIPIQYYYYCKQIARKVTKIHYHVMLLTFLQNINLLT